MRNRKPSWTTWLTLSILTVILTATWFTQSGSKREGAGEAASAYSDITKPSTPETALPVPVTQIYGLESAENSEKIVKETAPNIDANDTTAATEPVSAPVEAFKPAAGSNTKPPAAVPTTTMVEKKPMGIVSSGYVDINGALVGADTPELLADYRRCKPMNSKPEFTVWYRYSDGTIKYDRYRYNEPTSGAIETTRDGASLPYVVAFDASGIVVVGYDEDYQQAIIEKNPWVMCGAYPNKNHGN